MFFLGKKLYFKAYLRQKEALGFIDNKKQIKKSWLIGILIHLFPFTDKSIVRKEIITFLRTPVLTTQIFMLAAIVALYIYNIMLLPINKSLSMWADLSRIFGFLNIGMGSLIVSAACLRFVYPTLAIEGKSFYIIRTSPLGIWKYLRTKMIFFSFVFIIFAAFVVVFPQKILMSGEKVFLISLIDFVTLTIGIVAINLGLGIWFPSSGITSITEAPASIGGFMTMVATTFYVSLVLLFQSIYVFDKSFLFLVAKLNPFFNNFLQYGVLVEYSLLISGIITVLGWIIPLVMAWKKLEKGEGIA